MNDATTLVLTDVVDSTRLNSRLGDREMSSVWAEHDRCTRELIRAHAGREVGRSDGFLALFERVEDAVAFALGYHGHLASMTPQIRARVGIHSGRVVLRENSQEDRAQGATPFEVDGLALPVAARLMAAAGAGQTLVSSAVRAASDHLPCRQVSHGHWLFKGIDEPMEVFEISDDSSPLPSPQDSAKAYRVVWEAGRWLPAAGIPRQLPAERDGFVGRRDGLNSVSRSFEAGARLVSIIGIGGGGKTRLATRYAWEHLGDFPGGAWFCDISQARSIEGIFFGVARGLQVPLGQADPVVQLGQAIAGRGSCLVILDNFEQVGRYAEGTLGLWIERAPLARFVATSREVLGIVGETVLTLEPLSGADAAELFVQRAASACCGYAPGASDLAAIRELVHLLDCLPLAIELAAARVRVISPQALTTRVRNRFDLIGAKTGRQDRQLTLRATFDWSWELLSEQERAALARLSVFEGGFTLGSAASVLWLPGAHADDVVELVQGLVDKSLVRRVSDARFDLLETVRDYAGQRLVTEGSFTGSGAACAVDASTRHWRYFASLDERSAIADRCVDANNLVAACRAATDFGDAPSTAACVAVVWAALRLTGPYRVAVQLAEAACKLAGLDVGARAMLHWVAGDALELMGDVESARLHLQRGLACAAQAQAKAATARLLITLGSRQTLDGELEPALSNLEQASRLAVELDDPNLHMRALNALGLHYDHQSRWQQAQRSYAWALDLARSLDDRHMEGGLLGNLGGLFFDMGNQQAAQQHYEQSLAVAQEQGDRRWEGNARCNLGLLHQEQGRPAQARAQFTMAFDTARQLGHVRLEYTVLCNLGILLSSEGQLDEAGQHFEQAVAAAVACTDRRAEGQFRGYLALNQARRGLVEQAHASLDAGERLLASMFDRLSLGLLLCDRAEVELLCGRVAVARRAFDDATSISEALECKSDSDLCRRLAALAAMMGAPS